MFKKKILSLLQSNEQLIRDKVISGASSVKSNPNAEYKHPKITDSDPLLFSISSTLFDFIPMNFSHIYSKFSQSRNDIDHAGFKNKSLNSTQLKTKLKESFEEWTEFLIEHDWNYLEVNFNVNDLKIEENSPIIEVGDIKSNLLVLFSHELTAQQKDQAKIELNIDNIITPNIKVSKIWSSIPPSIDSDELNNHLDEVKDWILTNSNKGDYVLIQGEFGSTFIVVQICWNNDLIPIYSTTERIYQEVPDKNKENGSIKMIHTFKHVRYRKYKKI